jgi:dissimilatory sulfite reductase (desulfoviridin) alpha/beta subunit
MTTGGRALPRAPRVLQKLCRSCDACVAVCPHDAISLHGAELRIDEARCKGTDRCRVLCPAGALVRP